MLQNHKAPIVSVKATVQPYAGDIHTEIDLAAEKLLSAYQAGNSNARDTFKARHPAGEKDGFVPTMMDARQVIMVQNMDVHPLSLEKLKKEAKSFLRNLKSGDKFAIHRAKRSHPKVKSQSRSLNELSLTDAQHILALENGFGSWPKLKHHIDALDTTANTLGLGKMLDDPASLHIRCGNDIKAVMKQAGLNGTFLEVINPFSMGPVLPDPLSDRALKLRHDFMKTTLGPYIDEEERRHMKQRLIDEEKALQALPGQYKDITLWFEHDAYDQLCLAYILHHLSQKNPHLSAPINLVQVDRFPGIKRFVGIGQLCNHPENLALLFNQRLAITPDMVSFGASIWEAYTHSDPTGLWQLATEEDAALPLMQNAILRMLAELPTPNTGLGLTERLALSIIGEEGPLLARRAFLFSMAEHDPLPYHGDIMFFATLKALWSATNPALEIVGQIDGPGDFGKEILKLTPLGEAIMRGEETWLHHNPVIRWVGGVEINSSKDRNWCFEGSGKAPFLF